ncbi:helix-turn-helix domain-containing protein [Peribacillus butanolivorans]|uniref:helix-turn-helix domain-containing protein n=1 Tax=Peribacillus butanolivorans TaxID=421767 RepID=UPI00366BE825
MLTYSKVIKAIPPRKKIPEEVLQQIVELHNQGISNVEIARITGINRKTIGTHIKKLQQGN